MKFATMAACLLVACTTAHADKSAFSQHAKRSAFVETLTVGQEFKANQQTYQLLPEVFAVQRASPSDDPQSALGRMGIDSASFIEAKGRFVLYRLNQTRPVSAAAQQASGPVFSTVLNKRTKVIGVLQGTLVVKPNQMTDAGGIGSTYGLEVVKEYPHIQTVIYRMQHKGDVVSLLSAVTADPRVTSAYPEILEHEQVAN